MKYTEEEIIKLLREDSGTAERDQAAAMLLEQYAGLLWSVCQRRLQDPEDIKECVNSTFAQVCLHPERYDAKKGSLKNYLCMVADRKAIDCYHEKERRQRAEESFVQEMQSGAGVTRDITTGTHAANGAFMAMAAADGYASGEERAAEKLEEALEQLDPMDSQILRMKYYDGLTYQEIAHQLGLTEATVKMRSLRSRRKLLKILIVVLILALLAACAVAVLRRYQYSERGGVNWSEEPLMYELVEGEYAGATEYMRYELTDAIYRVTDEETREGEVTIYLTTHWLGDQETGWMVDYAGVVLEEFPRFHTDNGAYIEYGFSKKMYLEATQQKFPPETREYEVTMKWSLDEMGKEQVTIPLYREEQWVADLIFRQVDFVEYEDPEQELVLYEDLEWTLGPAVAGEDFTVVSLFQLKESDWTVSQQLIGSRYGLQDRESKSVVLTGEDGTEYPMVRTSYYAQTAAATQTVMEYDLYFRGAKAGEYQLHIPRLVLMRDWNSQEFVLSLPEEEQVYTACDVTALFPDGAGFHISGITKEEVIETAYGQDDDSDELVEYSVYYWKYTLELERISAGESLFHMAMIASAEDTLVLASVDQGGRLSFRIQQQDAKEEIRLQFVAPEYILEQEFTVDVIVQAVTQETAGEITEVSPQSNQ